MDGSRILKVPHPQNQTPREYQLEGARFLASKSHALLADDMGLGKTIQVALALNILRPAKIIILCPSYLKINWRDELDGWLLFTPKVLEIESIDSFWRTSRTHLRLQDWDQMIIDEAKYLKSPGASRTTMLYRNRARYKSIWALEGTPMMSRPMELYVLCKLLGRSQFPEDRIQFGTRYCGGMAADYRGAANLKELGDRMRSSFMLRRLKADVLSEIPEKTRQLIKVHPDTKTKEIISRMGQGYFNSGPDIVQETMSTEIKELGILKVPFIAQHVRTVMDSESHHIIFMWNKEPIQLLAESLKDLCPMIIDGSTSMKKRNEYVNRFQNSSSGLLIGNIKAAGVGLTLTKARTVTFGQSDWVPAVLTQAEDRIHRYGQKQRVVIYHIVFDGTLDVTMMKSVVSKQKNISKLLLN